MAKKKTEVSKEIMLQRKSTTFSTNNAFGGMVEHMRQLKNAFIMIRDGTDLAGDKDMEKKLSNFIRDFDDCAMDIVDLFNKYYNIFCELSKYTDEDDKFFDKMVRELAQKNGKSKSGVELSDEDNEKINKILGDE